MFVGFYPRKSVSLSRYGLILFGGTRIMNKYHKILGFDTITETLAEYCKTDTAQEKARNLAPFLREIQVLQSLSETNSARKMIDMLGIPSIPAVDDMKQYLDLVEKEGILYPHQLEKVMTFIASSRRLKNYLEKGQSTGESMSFIGDSISTFDEIYEEINRCLLGQNIDSNASTELKNIRRKIEKTNTQIQSKLEEVLKSKKSYCSDQFLAKKNGRYTLPVKKEYKNMVQGTVIAISSTGATHFIEPSSVSKLTSTLDGLVVEENLEVERILYSIASCIDLFKEDFHTNISLTETLDFAFAKGKLSMDMAACVPTITTNGEIFIEKGRHTLISECIPIDFHVGETYRGIVITGPNTGGKTATLKQVGLFCLMAQCGLHIPAKRAKISMFGNVLCDIGDGQNITQNLSTFSSHILNVKEILESCGNQSLVILDELGSGTDPTEGMGIAIAILEELRKRKCVLLATTHYEKVKIYAETADGLVNARMTFDRDTLQPKFELIIGEAGESCALHIAKKLGFPEHLLHHAQVESYGVNGGNLNFSTEINTPKPSSPKIEKLKEKHVQSDHATSFERGDSVHILPDKVIGIVYQSCDEKGNIGVQIRGEKQRINHKRLELKLKASELYPEDYDFSIIFDTVEFRKANKLMGKRYVKGLTIEHDTK
ncbi:MAG: DNA mismatch repair protein MutS [Eubacteriales bacterium]